VAGRAIRLLEEAPWLGEGLGEEALATARRDAIVPSSVHDPGTWRWDGPEPAVGLLIIDGRIARGLHVDEASAHGIEILGDGDLLRPWTFRGESMSIPSSADWVVMAELHLAVLDLAFVRAAMRWPRISINLLDSTVERTRTLSYFLTARQVARLEARILLTLWHLADRWGHVSPEGVVLELPKLTHEMIARMVAARRPSVTTGIRHLREIGVVEVRSRGRWLLRGDPVEALRRVNRRIPEPVRGSSDRSDI
jgi:CRP/FNR family transcriptional regulator, cyclic AMP receptor protein